MSTLIDIRPIARVLGILAAITGMFMLSCVPFSLYAGSADALPLALSALISLGIGLPPALLIPRREGRSINKREGYLIVALGWVVMCVFGMLPYLLSGAIPDVASALFETVSGVTTTGASVLSDIEAQDPGILCWRSLTQWIGGMGIIVLTVAILPLLGIGGVELFVAEAPGPTSDKLHPRISETAKRLWLIYVGLTVVVGILFYLEGMTGFDAYNHALTTMATGGFSTKNDSMAHYGPLIQYTTILFLFLSGANYTILYFGLKRKFRRVWQSEEFRAYLFLVLSLSTFMGLGVWWGHGTPAEQAFRDSLFTVVSLITTTGFVTTDYTAWPAGLVMLCFVLLFLGGCAGSTSGGIKIVRHLVFFKNSYLEFKRILHPRAVIPLKVSGQTVTGRIITHIIIFLLVYLIIFVMGCIVMSAMGYDFLTAIGAVATCLGNVGPAIGKVGPMDNFGWLSGEAKVFLSFLMLLGRLELFTILVLFTPFFWKSN